MADADVERQQALDAIERFAQAHGWSPNADTKAHWYALLDALLDGQRMVVVVPLTPMGPSLLRGLADALEGPPPLTRLARVRVGGAMNPANSGNPTPDGP